MKVKMPKMKRPVKMVCAVNCVRAGIGDVAEE